jgi:hypothetical protein
MKDSTVASPNVSQRKHQTGMMEQASDKAIFGEKPVRYFVSKSKIFSSSQRKSLIR